jgi:hypothetical protein
MKFRFSKFSGSESDYVIVDVITQGPFFQHRKYKAVGRPSHWYRV